MPPELEHPGDSVADDCAPQVPDVHLLRDVRAGEINHHPLRVRNPWGIMTVKTNNETESENENENVNESANGKYNLIGTREWDWKMT